MRPFPEWAAVYSEVLEGWSNSHGLQTAFTNASVSGGRPWARTPSRACGMLTRVHFSTDRSTAWWTGRRLRSRWRRHRRRYTLASTDQRHRAVFNGIWDVGYGFQLSGSTSRLRPAIWQQLRRRPARQRRRAGSAPAPGRHDRPAQHVRGRRHSPRRPPRPAAFPDCRQRRCRWHRGGVQPVQRRKLRLRHTQESNQNYGLPAFNGVVAYQPRMPQLGSGSRSERFAESEWG